TPGEGPGGEVSPRPGTPQYCSARPLRGACDPEKELHFCFCLARAQLVRPWLLCSPTTLTAVCRGLSVAARCQAPLRERDLRGFKYFRRVRELLSRLHAVGTARDKAGNREFFYDDCVALLLLYFFNPILCSLRGLQQASGLHKAQQRLGVRRTSLGSLSEATEVFPAEYLRHIVQELAEKALPLEKGRQAEALRGLT